MLALKSRSMIFISEYLKMFKALSRSLLNASMLSSLLSAAVKYNSMMFDRRSRFVRVKSGILVWMGQTTCGQSRRKWSASSECLHQLCEAASWPEPGGVATCSNWDVILLLIGGTVASCKNISICDRKINTTRTLAVVQQDKTNSVQSCNNKYIDDLVWGSDVSAIALIVLLAYSH